MEKEHGMSSKEDDEDTKVPKSPADDYREAAKAVVYKQIIWTLVGGFSIFVINCPCAQG